MIEAEGQQIDECLATVFKGQRSYTGEPVVEFSCHGSSYIIAQVMKSCLAKGARLAEAGEFPQWKNGSQSSRSSSRPNSF